MRFTNILLNCDVGVGTNPIDWGVFTPSLGKNYRSTLKIKTLLEFYQPCVVVLEEVKHSLRVKRIKALIQSITRLCEQQDIPTQSYHRREVLETFGLFGKHTKFEIAEIIAKWLPELANRLPEKRKNCDTESPEYGIFDAAALALVHLYKTD